MTYCDGEVPRLRHPELAGPHGLDVPSKEGVSNAIHHHHHDDMAYCEGVIWGNALHTHAYTHRVVTDAVIINAAV